MKAAVFQGIGIPHAIETAPDPAPAAHELIVQVEACGICGTDLHCTSEHLGNHPAAQRLARRYQPGAILGHEFSGVVVECGSAVKRFRAGDRIVSMGMTGCGVCEQCRAGVPLWCRSIQGIQGGFAEYTRASEFSSLVVQDPLTACDAALIEPLACAHHAVALSAIEPGQHVLVFGAGVIGLGSLVFALKAGAAKVVVCARSRRHAKLAEVMGAHAFFAQSSDLGAEVNEALEGQPHVVIEGVGVPGIIEQAMGCVASRGTIVIAGLSTRADTIYPMIGIFKELRMRYAFAYGMADFEVVRRLMMQDPALFRALVTRKVSFEEFPDAFEALRKPNLDCKIMLTPGSR